MDTLVIPQGLTTVAVAAIITVLVIAVAVWAVKALIVIVPPNSAAVVTGRKRQLGDGTQVGYRAVIGGRTMQVPIVEQVQWLSLETYPLEISVHNAFSKGNIPLDIEAIANVKIASEPEAVFNNAVERLLGKTETEIQSIARDTLMGNLRGVLATLTPEQVNEDRLGFAKALAEDAGEDLSALGLRLDVLKIQNVSDQRGYLAAIGRRKSAEAVRDAEMAEADAAAQTRRAQAEALRDAEIAEAEATARTREAQAAAQRLAQVAEAKEAAETREAAAAAEAEAQIAEAQHQARTRQAAAEARQVAEVKEAAADVEIAEADNRLRVRRAELAGEAERVERTTRVRAEQAEVEAQRALEEERVAREKIRLQADVVEPAEAAREAARAKAIGDAALTLEQGRATAEAFRLLLDEVRAGGETAFGVFVADKLPQLLATSVDAVKGIDIERLVILDGGDGNGVSNAANQKVRSALGTIEALGASVGLDLQAILASALAPKGQGGEVGKVGAPAGGAGLPAPATGEHAADGDGAGLSVDA